MFVNYRSRHRFNSDELTNIELFANQAAVAIRNAQLYEETVRRASALRAVYEAGKAVTSTLALDEILDCIAEQAWNLTGSHGKRARFSSIALLEENSLKVKAAYPSEHLNTLCEKMGDVDLARGEANGVIGRAFDTGRSQLVDDVGQDPHYIEYDPETCSELAVPIQHGEKIIGVINVEHPDYRAFDEDDKRDLESLAAQAAIAITNARQYEELKRTKGLVGARTALAWMGMASTAWRHTIDKHTVTIREQLQLLRQDLEHASSPLDHTKTIQRIAMIERLFEKILEKPLTPPLSRETGVERVSLSTLVGERAQQLWQDTPYNEAQLKHDLQLPESATVWASPEWLRRAFDMLVDNAVEAAAGCEVREVTISTRAVDGVAEILVSDTGPGIPEEMQAKIGLERIEKPEDAEGLGMGLLIAQTIAQTYRGDIRVESTGPSGTTMAIWLPLSG
jgi:GAF domain-containing protein